MDARNLGYGGEIRRNTRDPNGRGLVQARPPVLDESTPSRPRRIDERRLYGRGTPTGENTDGLIDGQTSEEGRQNDPALRTLNEEVNLREIGQGNTEPAPHLEDVRVFAG
ncbi:MAG: hypothetical protein ABSG61_02700 [Gemmatimonadales bacterium]